MPAQRPSRLSELPEPRPLPLGPSLKTKAARPTRDSDSEDANSMELGDESDDELVDMEHHSPVTSTVELGDVSDLMHDDRDCFVALSKWLNAVSLTRSVWNGCSFEGTATHSSIASPAQGPRRTARWWVYGSSEITVLNIFLDRRFRDAFGLRPELVNNGVSRDEINRILYDSKVFLGINKILDDYCT